MDKSEVLIVGAGPTGLTAALNLAKMGVKVRIIDKNEGRSDKSKALAVQAGTLECFENSIGKTLVEEMISAGRPIQGAWLHLNDSPPVKIDLSTIPSHYNFVLILEQNETERILEEHLTGFSIRVERQKELLEIAEQGSKVRSKLKTGEEIESDFVIGCDGAHSTTRHLLDFSFEGGAYPGTFILADVKLNWSWPYGSIQTFSSKRGAVASFPLRGDQRYRLILIPAPGQDFAFRGNLSLNEFQNLVTSIAQNPIEILEATWLTPFSIHHRMVRNFQRGRVFLAGDAAHIHSPAGGQGMNIGIQDALNLTFKLNDVLKGKKSIDSLKNYDLERRPVARAVLRATDFISRMTLLPETKITRWARQFVIPNLVKIKWLQRKIVSSVSEVSVAKREISRYI